MFLFILFLGAFFLPKTDSLQCYECSLDAYGKCNDKIVECPSQKSQCLASRVVSYYGESEIPQMEVKACAIPEDCLESSINVGKTKSVQMTSCCTTKLCNNKFPDYKSTPNGKKCFSCEGEDCTKTVNCQGEENHCIKLTANAAGVSATMKGCASNLMCSDKIASMLSMYSGVKFSCCQGDYCNSAVSASPTLLLLLVPLFFLALFC